MSFRERKKHRSAFNKTIETALCQRPALRATGAEELSERTLAPGARSLNRAVHDTGAVESEQGPPAAAAVDSPEQSEGPAHHNARSSGTTRELCFLDSVRRLGDNALRFQVQ